MFCIRCATELELKKVEGRKRYVCPACGYIHYENPLPVVAGLCYRKRGEILLIKRGIEPAKGQWALPTGFMEIDETIEEGLLRELAEEIGLHPEDVRHIGLVDVVQQYSDMYKSVIVMGFKVLLKKGVILHSGDDAVDYKFFNIKEMPEVPFVSQRHLIGKFILQQR